MVFRVPRREVLRPRTLPVLPGHASSARHTEKSRARWFVTPRNTPLLEEWRRNAETTLPPDVLDPVTLGEGGPSVLGGLYDSRPVHRKQPPKANPRGRGLSFVTYTLVCQTFSLQRDTSYSFRETNIKTITKLLTSSVERVHVWVETVYLRPTGTRTAGVVSEQFPHAPHSIEFTIRVTGSLRPTTTPDLP